MKKLVAFLITVVFAFALAACGNSGGDTDPSKTPSEATPSPAAQAGQDGQGEKSALKARIRYEGGADGMTYYMVYHFIDGKLDSQEEQFEFETAEKAVEWYTSQIEKMSDPSGVSIDGRLVCIVDESPTLIGTTYDSIRATVSGGEDTIEIID